MKKYTLLLAMLFIASTANAGLTGLGFGVHGGIVSGYDNPGLELGVVGGLSDYFGETIEIEMPDDMKNIGGHVIIGTLRVIEFDASIDYSWQKKTLFETAELRFSDLSISGSVRKSIPLAILKPYVGAGLGMHIMGYTLEADDQVIPLVDPNTTVEDESVIGFHFKAGVALDFPVFPLTPFVEWKYNSIKTSDESSKYSQVNLGITLDLP